MYEGIEIAETTYQFHIWDAPRRLVIVRQKISERPKAACKTLSLFEDDKIINGYRHSCYITNLTLPPAEIKALLPVLPPNSKLNVQVTKKMNSGISAGTNAQ